MAVLDAFGLVCEDMAASVRFYRLLGLEIPEGAEREQHVDIELGGGVRLMLDTVDLVKSLSDWEPASGGHRMGLAFRCADAADVDRVQPEMSQIDQDFDLVRTADRQLAAATDQANSWSLLKKMPHLFDVGGPVKRLNL